MSLLEKAVLGAYFGTLIVLAAYGVHRCLLVFLYLRHRDRRAHPPADPPTWPRVTVQLPVYNERYVVGRLIDAVASLDYPREALEIQVLDDSTDDTAEIAAA